MPSLSLTPGQPLADKILALPCDALARAAGFVRRASRKITPAGFLLTACLFGLQAAPSLAAFAQLWALLHQQTLSKQAVHKRCSAAAVAFLEAVLQAVVQGLVTGAGANKSLLPGCFGRILVQDSTNLALPKKLAPLFPGPANQRSQNQAALKIQATLDLWQNRWVQFRLTPFTCNDQAASPQILEGLQKNDLVIRDLGYFVLRVFKQIEEGGAFFLSRWRHGLQVALPGGGAKADLLKLLGSSALWDGPVLLGQEKLPVRLVAVRLPESVAAARRRKARADRDRRLRHGPEYFQLLGWNIFITNVPAQMLGARSLVQLYELRWRIEIIFKAWKSHFKMEHLPNASAPEVLIVVLGRLIWISWFTVQFNELAADGAPLSLLKAAAWWARFAPMLYQAQRPTPEILRRHIQYYCRYDKRKARQNYLEKFACLG